MNKIRKKITDELLASCLRNKAIRQGIMFFSVLGSTVSNEEVEGYSDLDILLVLESDRSGVISNKILRELKKISEEYSHKYSVEISLLTHTVFDFEKYVDFNYLIHYSWGKVLYGKKSKYMELFKKIIGKKYSNKVRKELIYYNLIHARFNLIRQYVSWNKFNKVDYKKKILKLLIDKIIEICDWALVYRDIFEKNKRGTVKNFNSSFSKNNYSHIPKQALSIRSAWMMYDFESKEAKIFIDESILFIQEVIKVIQKEHAQS
ncbi:MAG: hypothetical protein PHF79_00965 [Candidatus Pacebacteria bacterium]|nr:hypothetical protein [Candidatus Paceibacterota bacterium]